MEIHCDHKVPIRLKGKFYRSAVCLVMLYGVVSVGSFVDNIVTFILV